MPVALKRPRIIITLIVVILALVLAGILWWPHKSATISSVDDRYAVPADTWQAGTDQLWNITINANPEDSLYTTADYMVSLSAPTWDDEPSTFTTWDISGEKPKKLASKVIDGWESGYSGILGTHFVVEGNVYSILTGEEEDAPWEKGDEAVIFGDSLAVACNQESECAGYDSDLNEAWHQDLKMTSSWGPVGDSSWGIAAAHLSELETDVVQSDNNVKMLYPSDDGMRIIDLESGAITETDPGLESMEVELWALRDGWFFSADSDGDASRDDKEESDSLYFIDLDGTVTTPTDFGKDDGSYTQTLLITDGGIETLRDHTQLDSGKAGAVTIHPAGEKCDQLSINGNVGGDSLGYWTEMDSNTDHPEGLCWPRGFAPVIAASSAGKVLAVEYDGTLDVQTLINADTGEAIWTADSSKHQDDAMAGISPSPLNFGRLVSPNKLLAIDADAAGETTIIAYQPKG